MLFDLYEITHIIEFHCLFIVHYTHTYNQCIPNTGGSPLRQIFGSMKISPAYQY